MRKVYCLTPDLYTGGAQRVTVTIAKILKSEGFDVEFVNLGSPEGKMLDWITPEFQLTSFLATHSFLAFRKLYMFMKTHRECIFFSSRENVNVMTLAIAKELKIPTVVRIPNMPQNKLYNGIAGIRETIIKYLNRKTLPYAKAIIAQNDEMKDQLISYYDLPSTLVHVINNPVDKEYVIKCAKDSCSPFKNEEVNFINICNIAHSKGIDILIKAWPYVKDKIPNAHMYIIGRTSSEYAQKLIEEAKKLEDFTFIGYRDNPYVFLKHCDVFVLPSRMEGFPNVVLEAMCFNKPIVSTTCVNVIKDLIKPGRNGYYCDIENPEQLAKYMILASMLKFEISNYDLFNRSTLVNCFNKV